MTYNPSNITKDGVRVLRSSNIDEEYFVASEDDVFVKRECVNIPYCKNGDILVTAANGSSKLVGKHAVLQGLLENSAVHGGFMILGESNNPAFINASMSSSWYIKFINLHVAGGNGAIGNLNKNDLENQPVLFPNSEEQVKIGKLFDDLDELITLHQRELIYSNCFKSKMYLPVVEFENTFSWEQRKFGDEVKLRRGLTYNPSNITKDGVRVLRSSNIDEEYFVASEDDVFVKRECVNIPYCKNGDILVTAANGSSKLVGKHAVLQGLLENSAVHGGFMILGESNNPAFINASMSSSWYIKFINLHVAGGNGAIGNLNKNDLENQHVLFPNSEEQVKIGKLFEDLDELITLHQRE